MTCPLHFYVDMHAHALPVDACEALLGVNNAG